MFLLCFCVCSCVETCSTASVWRWEGNFWESVFSFYHMGPGLWIPVFRLGSNWPYPLSNQLVFYLLFLSSIWQLPECQNKEVYGICLFSPSQFTLHTVLKVYQHCMSQNDLLKSPINLKVLTMHLFLSLIPWTLTWVLYLLLLPLRFSEAQSQLPFKCYKETPRPRQLL